MNWLNPFTWTMINWCNMERSFDNRSSFRCMMILNYPQMVSICVIKRYWSIFAFPPPSPHTQSVVIHDDHNDWHGVVALYHIRIKLTRRVYEVTTTITIVYYECGTVFFDCFSSFLPFPPNIHYRHKQTYYSQNHKSFSPCIGNDQWSSYLATQS